jgi:RNA polymerase sigma factor (sigma-70 family)
MEVSALKYHGGIGLHGRSSLLRLQSDDRLVAFVRRGNTAAFEALVGRYESRLLAFCRHMLGSREDAEDVLQEVFAAAFNALLADDRPINVKPWLYRIARNRSLNHLRRAQAVGVDSMDIHFSDFGATTADKVHDREEFRLLVGDIHELPESQKTALVLREMDALSYEQIAEAMETTVPSVKSLLVRARVSLAEAAEARLLSCDEVRVELGEIAEGLRRRPSPLVRRHMRSCERCSRFKVQLRQTNRALAALLPIGPLVLLRRFVASHLGHGAGSGSAAGGAAGSGAISSGAGAGAAAGAGLAASGAGVTAGGSAIGAGGLLAGGVGAMATKAAVGLAAAALVTAGAVEVDHTSAPVGSSAPVVAQVVHPQAAVHSAVTGGVSAVPTPRALKAAAQVKKNTGVGVKAVANAVVGAGKAASAASHKAATAATTATTAPADLVASTTTTTPTTPTPPPPTATTPAATSTVALPGRTQTQTDPTVLSGPTDTTASTTTAPVDSSGTTTTPITTIAPVQPAPTDTTTTPTGTDTTTTPPPPDPGATPPPPPADPGSTPPPTGP